MAFFLRGVGFRSLKVHVLPLYNSFFVRFLELRKESTYEPVESKPHATAKAASRDAGALQQADSTTTAEISFASATTS